MFIRLFFRLTVHFSGSMKTKSQDFIPINLSHPSNLMSKQGLELKSSWCRVDNMEQNILLQHEIDKTFPLVDIYGLIDSSLQFSKNCIRLRIEFSSIYKFFLQPANILRLYIFCVNKLLIYQQTLHSDVSFKF